MTSQLYWSVASNILFSILIVQSINLIPATLFGVKSINGINTSNIMYTDQPHITLIGGVAFNSVHVNGDFSASSLLDGCVLPKVTDYTIH